MLESAQPLFEFEAIQEGVTYPLRLVRFARSFWLERRDEEDWLGKVDDVFNEIREAFKISEEAEVRLLTQRALRENRVSRAFQWDDKQKVFVLWSGNSNFWFDAHSSELQHFVSQTSWYEGSFWGTTGEIFRRRFEKEWKNPQCDARDAFTYLYAPQQERLRRAVLWTRGGWDEIEPVVSAAMRIEFEGAQTLAQLANSSKGRIEWIHSPHDSIESERLKRLLAVVDERNVRAPYRWPPVRRGGYRVEVQIGTASMHDRIEARLFLLDWLHKYAPQLVGDWE
ncbi:hypothetical protein EON83_21045 [bacterium]|nr:MAG: hypothetical protein EON83_21045 [bacterium]